MRVVLPLVLLGFAILFLVTQRGGNEFDWHLPEGFPPHQLDTPAFACGADQTYLSISMLIAQLGPVQRCQNSAVLGCESVRLWLFPL